MACLRSYVFIFLPSSLNLSSCKFSLLALSLAGRETAKLATRLITTPNPSDLLLTDPIPKCHHFRRRTTLCFLLLERTVCCGCEVTWGLRRGRSGRGERHFIVRRLAMLR